MHSSGSVVFIWFERPWWVMCCLMKAMDFFRGCSSIGRAPALQAGGRRFDSVQLHHFLLKCSCEFLSKNYWIYNVSSLAGWRLWLYVLLHREEEIYLIRQSVEWYGFRLVLLRICTGSILFFVGLSSWTPLELHLRRRVYLIENQFWSFLYVLMQLDMHVSLQKL